MYAIRSYYDLWSIATPSWIEDPTPVIKTLRDAVMRPDHDPRGELAALAEEREHGHDDSILRREPGNHVTIAGVVAGTADDLPALRVREPPPDFLDRRGTRP